MKQQIIKYLATQLGMAIQAEAFADSKLKYFFEENKNPNLIAQYAEFAIMKTKSSMEQDEIKKCISWLTNLKPQTDDNKSILPET